MLIRDIRKWDLVLLMINGIIGAGIFGLPSRVFELSGAYSLVALFVCAIAIFFIILCFAEVGSRFSKTGGPYIYTLEAFGRFPAFLMGWLLLASRIVTFAALVNLLVIYLSFFSPFFAEPTTRIVTILFIVFVLSWINHIGIRHSTRFSNIMTISKLLPLLLFIVVGFFYIEPGRINFGQAPSFNDFSKTALLLAFAFSGFEAVVVNTGEVKNPSKAIPFALLTAAIVVAVFYALIQLVSIGTLPGLADSEKPLADAAALFMGAAGGNLIAAGAIISVTGTLSVVLLTGARLPFALSEEKQFPALFSFVHPKFKTPTYSLLLYSVITAIISLSGSFISSLTISAITKVLIFLVVCSSLIKLRLKKKENDYFKIPYGYFFAIAGIILSIWLLTGSAFNEFRDVAIVLLVGAVLFGVNRVVGKRG